MSDLPLQFLFDRFGEEPRRVAFLHHHRSTTYGELTAAVAASEAVLDRRGIGEGDVVVVIGDYSPGIVALLLALARRRAIVVPLSPASVIERDVVMEISRAAFVVEWNGSLDESSFTASGLLAEQHPLLDRLRDRGSPGLLLFSSGSSGTPKAILHDLGKVAEKFRRRSTPMVAIAFLMLDHFGGLNTLLAITSALGTLVTVPDRSVETICRAIAEHRVELLPATPSFLNMLVRADMHMSHDLSSLVRITYGTEVMPQTTLDRLREAIPNVTLQQTYGLSELGVLRSKSRDDGSLYMRLGGEGFELQVRDGSLWVRSAYAMEGYLNAPTPFDADGWFDTNDRVEVEGEWIRVLGRSTDLINIAGQKVYPAEVEEVILTIENVVDVVVHGEPNALVGSVVVARLVIARPEPLSMLRARVRAACASRLAAYKVPQKVMIARVDELTSVRMKKLRGPVLRQEETSHEASTGNEDTVTP